MSADGPVTVWFERLQAGDADAARYLWDNYFRRLVGLARARLERQGLPRRAADEEDVALSAFDSFCRGAAAGRFARLGNRGDLWRVLVTITARKAGRLARDQRRQKRGGGAVVGESAVKGPDGGLDQLGGGQPTPALAAEVADEFRRLLDLLDDDEQRAIALWKMEGDSNPEIARRLGCALSTVERRLALIRRIWAAEAPAE
jgi:DNA-directed RNA polymerase specialized sigma24 family protein